MVIKLCIELVMVIELVAGAELVAASSCVAGIELSGQFVLPLSFVELSVGVSFLLTLRFKVAFGVPFLLPLQKGLHSTFHSTLDTYARACTPPYIIRVFQIPHTTRAVCPVVAPLPKMHIMIPGA